MVSAFGALIVDVEVVSIDVSGTADDATVVNFGAFGVVEADLVSVMVW